MLIVWLKEKKQKKREEFKLVGQSPVAISGMVAGATAADRCFVRYGSPRSTHMLSFDLPMLQNFWDTQLKDRAGAEVTLYVEQQHLGGKQKLPEPLPVCAILWNQQGRYLGWFHGYQRSLYQFILTKDDHSICLRDDDMHYKTHPEVRKRWEHDDNNGTHYPLLALIDSGAASMSSQATRLYGLKNGFVDNGAIGWYSGAKILLHKYVPLLFF